MKELLAEIQERLQAALPGLDSFFLPPATEQDLRNTEEELGFSLPADLREFYLIHNGETENGPGLFFGLPFLSLEDMLTEWRIWAGLEEECSDIGDHDSVPAGWIKEKYINRYWIPISKDWGGNNLGIDLDPDERGVKGQVINFGPDEEVKYVIARNIGDLLQYIRDMLVAGNYGIQQEEDYVSWSFGRKGEVHFLDAIRSLELPVLEPIRENTNALDVQEWFAGQKEEWKERILDHSRSPEAFLRAKKLLLIRKGLTDIAPLAFCKEVRELLLSANEIRSIEPFSGCEQLKRLYLTQNPVSDLRPLQKLPHLQELNLAETAVTDVSALSCMPKLTKLDVQHTEIRDFSPLQSIQSLRVLEVSQPDADQLHSLSTLTQLQELTISGLGEMAESDIHVLGQLVNLRTLQLEEVSLPNLAFLRNCRKLQNLILKDSDVQDMSALAFLENLKTLELDDCPDVGKLEEIARSTSLRKVTASFQQFFLLKDRFEQKIDFSTITGEMTDEEEEIWLYYNR